MPYLFKNPNSLGITRLRAPTANNPFPAPTWIRTWMEKLTHPSYLTRNSPAHRTISSYWQSPMRLRGHQLLCHIQMNQEVEGGVMHFHLKPWRTGISRHSFRKNTG